MRDRDGAQRRRPSVRHARSRTQWTRTGRTRGTQCATGKSPSMATERTPSRKTRLRPASPSRLLRTDNAADAARSSAADIQTGGKSAAEGRLLGSSPATCPSPRRRWAGSEAVSRSGPVLPARCRFAGLPAVRRGLRRTTGGDVQGPGQRGERCRLSLAESRPAIFGRRARHGESGSSLRLRRRPRCRACR